MPLLPNFPAEKNKTNSSGYCTLNSSFLSECILWADKNTKIGFKIIKLFFSFLMLMLNTCHRHIQSLQKMFSLWGDTFYEES